MPGQAAQVPRRLGLGTGGALAGARGQVGARRHRESPGGGRGVSRPGGPPGAGGPGSGRGARLLSASGRAPGPASRDASLPFRPEPGPRLPGSPRRSPPASGPPLWAPRSRDLPPSRPSSSFPLRPPSPRVPSPVFPPPSVFTCRGSGDVEARAASSSERAPRVRNPFPPPPLRSLRRGAARGWRAAVAAGGKRRSRERAERGHTAALRPTREEQPRRSPPRAGARRERAGGRPRGEGSRGRRNGCHVARWIAALRPRPGSGP